MYLPAMQAVHTTEVLLDATLLYALAEHAVHAPLPMVNEVYVPATQAVHTADRLAVATLPYMPAPQVVHVVDTELPAWSPYEPTPHAVQAKVPVVSALKAPATHAVHTADVDPATIPL